MTNPTEELKRAPGAREQSQGILKTPRVETCSLARSDEEILIPSYKFKITIKTACPIHGSFPSSKGNASRLMPTEGGGGTK